MKTVTVFCASSDGTDPQFQRAASEIGGLLARRGLSIVYGGSRLGLMGRVADAALAEAGRVVGVIPKHMLDRGIGHEGLTELHVVQSMHERKALMADFGEGFIALPGGMGTLEELAEIVTWAQIGLHRKPCGVLNVGGYYDHLLSFIDHAVAAGFIRPLHRSLVLSADSPEKLVDLMANWEYPEVDKWTG